jgi:hypothetical protein
LPVNALPGVVTDVIAVATPDLSMSSSDLDTLQAITGGCNSLLNSVTYFGGAMWWWTSMRCGLPGLAVGAWGQRRPWRKAGAGAEPQRSRSAQHRPPAQRRYGRHTRG